MSARNSEVRNTVGQTSIAHLQPNFIQPTPNVLQAVPCAEKVLNFRPHLADLPDLCARFFPRSLAETVDVELSGSVVHY